MQAEFDQRLAMGTIDEVVVRVQVRTAELLAQIPPPAALGVAHRAARDRARLADVVENALKAAQQEQRDELLRSMRDPLTAVDEALLKAWEGLWGILMTAGAEREAVEAQLVQLLAERRQLEDEAAEARKAADAMAEQAERDRREAEARRLAQLQAEEQEGFASFRRAAQQLAELQQQVARLRLEAAEVGPLRARLAGLRRSSPAARGKRSSSD